MGAGGGTADFTLGGNGWFLGWLGINNTGGTGTSFTDANGVNANIDRLSVEGSLTVNMVDSTINFITTYGGTGTDVINLGSQYTQAIGLGGATADVTVGSGGLGALQIFDNTQGDVTVGNGGELVGVVTSDEDDTLTINFGEVAGARLNGGNNEVDVTNGSIGALFTDSGNDSVSIGDNGGILTWADDGGTNELDMVGSARLRFFDFDNTDLTVNMADDARAEQGELDGEVDITMSDNARLEYLRMSGDITANLSGNSRIDELTVFEGDADITMTGNTRVRNMRLEEGTHEVTTDTRSINNIELWESSSTIVIGSGGVNTIRADGDKSQSHDLTLNGYVDFIRMGDKQDSLITVNSDAGSMNLRDGDHEVTVQNGAGVNLVRTDEGKDDIIVNGGGFIDTVRTRDDKDDVEVNDGRVNRLDTGEGNDTISVETDGEAGVIKAGDGNDRVTVRGGYSDVLDTGSGDDRVWLRNDADINSLKLRDGNSAVQVRNNAEVNLLSNHNGDLNLRLTNNGQVDFIRSSQGDATIKFSSQSRANTIQLSEGTHNIDTNKRFVENIAIWESTSSIDIGSGGAGNIRIFGDTAASHTLEFDGHVDQMKVGDDQAIDLTWDTEGGGEWRLGDANDSITGGDGHVEALFTGGGGDSVTLIGSAGTVKTGDGNDDVTTGDEWVEFISTGRGRDEVILGEGGANTVRLGDGDDTISVVDSNDVYGLDVRGSGGYDIIDFSRASVGVTFTLDSIGIWQNAFAPGGDIEAPSRGYISETSVDGIIGSSKADSLTGDSAGNGLDGGSGKDTLTGQGGDDTLTGGNAVDTFVFGADSGTDTITDFKQGTDLISIVGQTSGFAGLTISDVNGDRQIVHDGGTILLEGQAGLALVDGDFIF